MPVVSDYTALISGSAWNGIEVSGKPVIVTYSFPTAAPAYDASIDGFTAATVSSFQAFSPVEQTQARAALGEWAAASGLLLVEVAPGKGDIDFQRVDLGTTPYSGAGGIGFYPFGDWNFATYPSFSSDLDASGDVFMQTGGAIVYGTLLHEIGHAIGLKHPTEVVIDYATQTDIRKPTIHNEVLSSDDASRTIMAQSGIGTGHLLALDQQAAAYLYGAAGTGAIVTANASGTNSVSSWSWNKNTQILTQTGFGTDDIIRGSSVNDVINGLGGGDRLFGLDGNDTLNGGEGNDFLDGGPGVDQMTGGIGNDTYVVDSAVDKIIELADGGQDYVYAFSNYTLAANIEDLQVFGENLTARGNDLANRLFGDGASAGRLYGMGGADYIVGGAGKDLIDGGAGADAMFGNGGDDTYYVDDANDLVGERDGGGNDRVYASVSWTLGAGSYVETIYAHAGSGALTLTGNELANRIYGGTLGDTLIGGGGNDALYGGTGNDRLVGGAGIDQFYGQDGADTFVLSNLSVDRDTIHAFTHGSDALEISASLFGGELAPGALSMSQFEATANGLSTAADTRFVYNTTSGALWFDTNGSAAGGRQQVATLLSAPTLTASDFSIVS